MQHQSPNYTSSSYPHQLDNTMLSHNTHTRQSHPQSTPHPHTYRTQYLHQTPYHTSHTTIHRHIVQISHNCTSHKHTSMQHTPKTQHPLPQNTPPTNTKHRTHPIVTESHWLIHETQNTTCRKEHFPGHPKAHCTVMSTQPPQEANPSHTHPPKPGE